MVPRRKKAGDVPGRWGKAAAPKEEPKDPPKRRKRAEPTRFDAPSAPVLLLVDEFEDYARDGERSVLENAKGALDRFESAALAAGVPQPTIKPARYALALLIDQKARTTPRIKLSTWSVMARQQLFDGRDISVNRVREFRAKAAGAGAPFADLATFLDQMIVRLSETRHGDRARPRTGRAWGWIAAGSVMAFALALASYAAFLEYRFHARILADFDLQMLEIGLDRPREGADLVQRLVALDTAVSRVARAAERAPFQRRMILPIGDSETVARAAYAEAVEAQMPGLVATAVETTLATEGDGLKLYDALRAWAVLTGDVPWAPGYIAGWLEDAGPGLGLDGAATHAAALPGPETGLAPRDPVMMDQARAFAAETSESERAWLELKRADAVRALPRWVPVQAVPGIETVVLTRSGTPLESGLPGLFTAEGWDYARDFGIGVAVRDARAIGPGITGGTPPVDNATPDLVLDRLHEETMSAWADWLADLRVRPFRTREQAILVSGTLARATNPVSQLLQEVWVQMGGTDRQRSHDQQLALARAFGPTIQYVEQGRMAEIARLFSQLNVALGAADFNEERAAERLMNATDRARSVQTLRSAPPIVVQIAEDVLAQSARPDEGLSQNPLTRQWQQLVYPLCRSTAEGHYPFADGPDATPGDLAALLGPSGALTLFVASASNYLDTSQSPWRWQPEARFEGLTPESAAFFERAVLVSQALYGTNGQLGMNLTLAALAERGQTMVAIGGAAAPVRATGAPATLSWPGAQPERGIEVSFREGVDAARLIHEGTWGLLRMMDGLRLRLRDNGARVLLDLRTDEGRVFLDMGLGAPINPVSARAALRGFTCPPVL